MSEVARAGIRLMVVLAAGGVVATPGLQGQEPDSVPDSSELDDGRFSISPGIRMELNGMLSPGGSLRFTWYPRFIWPWLSLQFHVQMIRESVPGATQRDILYFGRFMVGRGRGDGPSAFAFLEMGVGAIRHDPDPFLLDYGYDLWGVGLGLAYSLWGLTATLDLSHGGMDRLTSPNRRTSSGASIRYNLF